MASFKSVDIYIMGLHEKIEQRYNHDTFGRIIAQEFVFTFSV